MSGLVGYASSDEDDDIQPEKPAKIVKTAAHDSRATELPEPQPQANASHEPVPYATAPTAQTDDTPAPGPSAPPDPSARPRPSSPRPEASRISPPPSPYTSQRSTLRNLTMPTHPNFNIPPSPPPPTQNSEEAASLSATTKKFDRFLELKKQSVHFNSRLENNSALRNPSLLPKLMDFAGIREEASYVSTLAVGDGGISGAWPESWYVEALVRENERREKKAKGERRELAFVKEGAASRGSSKAGTPKSAGGGGSGSEHRKSKFERR